MQSGGRESATTWGEGLVEEEAMPASAAGTIGAAVLVADAEVRLHACHPPALQLLSLSWELGETEASPVAS